MNEVLSVGSTIMVCTVMVSGVLTLTSAKLAGEVISSLAPAGWTEKGWVASERVFPSNSVENMMRLLLPLVTAVCMSSSNLATPS